MFGWSADLLTRSVRTVRDYYEDLWPIALIRLACEIPCLRLRKSLEPPAAANLES